MKLFIKIQVISLSSLCCVQMNMLRYSCYKTSSQESLDEEDLSFIAAQVHNDIICALIFSSTVACRNTLFDKDSRKCSFVEATVKLNQQEVFQPTKGNSQHQKILTTWIVTQQFHLDMPK